MEEYPSNCFVNRFPDKTKPLRKEWVVKVRRAGNCGQLWEPGPHAVLCSEHFQKTDYMDVPWLRNKLKPGAVPSVFEFAHPVKGRKAPAVRNLFDSPSAQGSSNDKPEPDETISPDKKKQRVLLEVNN